jgi:hypothetical protein
LAGALGEGCGMNVSIRKTGWITGWRPRDNMKDYTNMIYDNQEDAYNYIKYNDGSKMAYQFYLKTPWWKERRKNILELYHHECAGCHSTQNLQVHHQTYKRDIGFGRTISVLFNEADSELQVLCDRCHNGLHVLENASKERDGRKKYAEEMRWKLAAKFYPHETEDGDIRWYGEDVLRIGSVWTWVCDQCKRYYADSLDALWEKQCECGNRLNDIDWNYIEADTALRVPSTIGSSPFPRHYTCPHGKQTWVYSMEAFDAMIGNCVCETKNAKS